MQQFIRQYGIPLCLLIAVAGLIGSLFFSEVRGLVPCLWCWYQRIALYPLVPVLAIGLVRRDAAAWQYALPLSVIGSLMGLYHVLLTYGVFTESASCRNGVSCATITWSYGFLTIPLLSLLAFVFITALLLLYKKYH